MRAVDFVVPAGIHKKYHVSESFSDLFRFKPMATTNYKSCRGQQSRATLFMLVGFPCFSASKSFQIPSYHALPCCPLRRHGSCRTI